MKANERDKLRRKLRTPDENGVYHYPLPHSGFVRIIGGLPSEEGKEYWRLYDRRALEGKQLSAKAQLRFDELGHKAHRLWDEKMERDAQEPTDTWFDDLKARMWAKLNPEQRAYWLAEVARRQQTIDW